MQVQTHTPLPSGAQILQPRGPTPLSLQPLHSPSLSHLQSTQQRATMETLGREDIERFVGAGGRAEDAAGGAAADGAHL